MSARTACALVPVLALAVALAVPAGTRACDPPCCTYKTVVCYERVTCYETREVAYTKTVTCCDECGHAYTVTKTCYREVQVPLTKVVAVTRRVKVCE